MSMMRVTCFTKASSVINWTFWDGRPLPETAEEDKPFLSHLYSCTLTKVNYFEILSDSKRAKLYNFKIIISEARREKFLGTNYKKIRRKLRNYTNFLTVCNCKKEEKLLTLLAPCLWLISLLTISQSRSVILSQVLGRLSWTAHSNIP